MYDTILIPTDGSNVAVTAAKTALALATEFDAEIHTIHVLDREKHDTAYGKDVVEAIQTAATEIERKTTTEVLEGTGPVHDQIIDYAAEHDVDCIVMGTHGQKPFKQYVLGSVTERTLRDAQTPVITVNEETIVPRDIERILIPTDGSDGANAAAEHGIAFAKAVDAAVHIIHVVDVSEFKEVQSETIHDALEERGQHAIDGVIEHARTVGVSGIEASLLSGVPDRAIQSYVGNNDIQYLFMGTHGRTGMRQRFLGSVTERVVRMATVPVVSLTASD